MDRVRATPLWSIDGEEAEKGGRARVPNRTALALCGSRGRGGGDMAVAGAGWSQQVAGAGQGGARAERGIPHKG